MPRHCITQGLGTILRARHLVLLAFGEEKAEAVAGAVEGPVTASLPGSAIQLHPHVTVIVDEAAASELRTPTTTAPPGPTASNGSTSNVESRTLSAQTAIRGQVRDSTSGATGTPQRRVPSAQTSVTVQSWSSSTASAA